VLKGRLLRFTAYRQGFSACKRISADGTAPGLPRSKGQPPPNKVLSDFRRAQFLTGATLALSHGTNDAQKTMGVITLGLVTAGFLSDFRVPTWVIALSAGAIALGTALGGWRLIRTLGGKFYKIRPVHGFNTQVTSASVILGAALLGGPVSTTQVVSSAILGVGAAERLSKVSWNVAGNIALAWLLTLPATALLAAVLYWVVVWVSPLLVAAP